MREPVCFWCDETAKRVPLVERRDGDAVSHWHRGCLPRRWWTGSADRTRRTHTGPAPRRRPEGGTPHPA